MARASGAWKIRGEILTADEARALLKACNRGPTGDRNRAFLALLWRSGLRTFEALALNVADLHSGRNCVYVRRGKGGTPKKPKDRWVGVDDGTFALLDVWLQRRRAIDLGSKHRVFLTLKGERLSDRYCRDMIKRVAANAGIDRRVHLHALRHTHAMEQIREGTTLPEVQAQLGHSNISTTNTYLAHVSPDDLAAIAKKRPDWINE